jgi:predicted nucleic acid-binding protein
MIDIELAKSAGVLCGLAGTDDPVDALVVASAARRGDDIVTTDPEDLAALAAVAPGVGRILDLNAL